MSNRTVPASVVDSPKARRRESAPWYVWVAVAAIIIGAVSSQSRRGSEASPRDAAITPEIRQLADNQTKAYIANGVIQKVTPQQAYVSGDWYEMTIEQKKTLAGALKIHFNASHYKFLDLRTGKVVAEYGELLGFRVH